MIHRHALGVYPNKPHTAFYENGKLLMEQMVTRDGFDGAFTCLYYRLPPTDEFEVETLKLPGFCPVEPVREQPLHRRHIKTQDIPPGGDFLTGRKTLALSQTLDIGLCKPTDPPGIFSATVTATSCTSSRAAAVCWKACTACSHSASMTTS